MKDSQRKMLDNAQDAVTDATVALNKALEAVAKAKTGLTMAVAQLATLVTVITAVNEDAQQ